MFIALKPAGTGNSPKPAKDKLDVDLTVRALGLQDDSDDWKIFQEQDNENEAHERGECHCARLSYIVGPLLKAPIHEQLEFIVRKLFLTRLRSRSDSGVRMS